MTKKNKSKGKKSASGPSTPIQNNPVGFGQIGSSFTPELVDNSSVNINDTQQKEPSIPISGKTPVSLSHPFTPASVSSPIIAQSSKAVAKPSSGNTPLPSSLPGTSASTSQSIVSKSSKTTTANQSSKNTPSLSSQLGTPASVSSPIIVQGGKTAAKQSSKNTPNLSSQPGTSASTSQSIGSKFSKTVAQQFSITSTSSFITSEGASGNSKENTFLGTLNKGNSNKTGDDEDSSINANEAESDGSVKEASKKAKKRNKKKNKRNNKKDETKEDEQQDETVNDEKEDKGKAKLEHQEDDHQKDDQHIKVPQKAGILQTPAFLFGSKPGVSSSLFDYSKFECAPSTSPPSDTIPNPPVSSFGSDVASSSSSSLFINNSFGMGFTMAPSPVEKPKTATPSIFAQMLDNPSLYDQIKTDKSVPASASSRTLFGPTSNPTSSLFNQTPSDKSISTTPATRGLLSPISTASFSSFNQPHPKGSVPASPKTSPRVPSLFDALPVKRDQVFSFARPLNEEATSVPNTKKSAVSFFHPKLLEPSTTSFVSVKPAPKKQDSIVGDVKKSRLSLFKPDVPKPRVEIDFSALISSASPVIPVPDLAKSDITEVKSDAATKTSFDASVKDGSNAEVVIQTSSSMECVGVVDEAAPTKSNLRSENGSSLEAVSKASEHAKSEQQQQPGTSSGKLVLDSVKPFFLRSSTSSLRQQSLAATQAKQESEDSTSDIHHLKSSIDEVKGSDEKVEEDRKFLDVSKANRLRDHMVKDVQKEDVVLRARKNLAKGRLTRTLQKAGIELPGDVESASVKDLERLVELAQSKTKIVKNSRSMALWEWIILLFMILSALYCLGPMMEEFVASSSLLSNELSTLSRTSLYHVHKLDLDLPEPQIDNPFKQAWFKSRTPVVRHPCIDFLRAQKADLAELYAEEQAVLRLVHNSLTPSIPKVIASPQRPTLAQLVELKTSIAETSQRFANIDRKISEHIHRQREGSAVCVKLPDSAPVTLLPRATVTPPPGTSTAVAAEQQRRNWHINLPQSLKSALKSNLALPAWLPSIDLDSLSVKLRSKFPNLLPPAAAPQVSLIPSTVVPSAPRFATRYDTYFMAVERSLARSQRGYRYFQSRLRRLSGDVSVLAAEWLTEGEVRVLDALEDWVGGMWEGIGSL